MILDCAFAAFPGSKISIKPLFYDSGLKKLKTPTSIKAAKNLLNRYLSVLCEAQ
jgi:hypothetical protein